MALARPPSLSGHRREVPLWLVAGWVFFAVTPPIEAAKEGRQFASGLFRDSRGGLALSFSAPVFDARGEGDAPASGSALGAVVLVVDPVRGLYPLLSKHSPETRTEETFLVREEKGAIQLLSPIPLGSRKPLDVFEKESAWFASAPSLGAKEASGEFHDYRGQAVLAATRSIPRPGWGLVVKVDREEAMRPFERLRLWAWASAAGSFLLLTAVALAWSRHVSSRHYRDLAQRDARYRALLEETNDAIAAEAGGQIVFANPAFLRLFGRQADEVLDKPFHLLVAPESREKLLEVRTALLDGDPVPETLEASAQTAGGARFDVEIRPALASLEGRDAMQMTLRDITRRKRAEVRLHRSEERYRSLFERNLAGVYRSDFSGRLLDCNEAFARILGFESREEALTHPTTSYYFDREGRSKLIARLLAERSLTNLEVRLRRKDGEPVWVLENVTLTRAEDGSLSILEGTIVDISARQRVDEAVRESEERFRRLADATFEGIAITENGKFLETNPQFVEMFGYAPEELPGKNVLELVAPESRDQVAEAIRAGYDRPYETVCLRKNGTVFPVEVSGRPFPYQGRTVRVTAVRDITERKRAEEVLRQSEEKYRDFVENSDALICLHDLAGKILSVNPAAARSLGYEPEDCVGKNIRAFLSPETHPAFDDYLLKIRREGTAQGHMAVLTGGGERRIWQYHNSLRAEGAAGPLVRGMAIDVTDQRRAEEALRESEALYRAVTETATDAIVTMDSESTIHFANAAAERIFGYTREEMLGRSLKMLMPERLRHAHEIGLSHYNRTGERRLSWASLQLPGLHKSGREVPLEISFGEVVRAGKRLFTGIIRGITERARAEEALRRSEERYRLLFERNLAGVYRSTADGRLLECNEAFARIMGYSNPEEAMARPAEAFHEFPQEREEFLSRLRAQGSLLNFESRARRKDGSRVWLLENVTILPAEGDRPEVLQGAVIDITQRKRGEEALQRSLRRQEALLNNIPDAAWMKDAEGRFIAVNDAFARSLGRPREEILGRTDFDFFTRELADKFRAEDREVIRGGKALQVANVYTPAGGREIAFETVKAPIWGEASVPVGTAGIARDVTERKRGEEALRRSEEQLTQSQKIEAVGQLAGGIAHDFNNLLTAIGGYSELLLGDLTPGDPRRDHAEEIRKAGERAASLTRQLLAYSRRQVLAPKVLDLNAVVSGLEKILRRLIGEHILLRARPFRGLWNVKADPGQLEQAILNLAINARDAMPDGGKLTIETANVVLDEAYALSHATVVPGSYAMVAVSDTGTGMTDEVTARVFEPFFTTKEKGKGTGLGLSTTYGIVKQSGGYIWCYSEPGHGTSFKIYLPRVREKVEETAAPAPSPIQHGDETILLVEDEPEVRSLVRKILAMQGYTVFPAAGPEEAMLLSRRFEGRIGLMLSDVVMPGLSGKQLADRLADSRPEMKVLFMSGYTDDAIVHRGILDPGTAFLQKPFTPQALARKVREVLDAPAEEFKIS